MTTKNRLLLSYARETRERGVYIIGNSGCGKSTLALRMMLNDIEEGCGICLVDPKGTTARRLLRYIPKHRVADTIYFSGKDPLPINIMRATDPDEEQNLAGDIAAFFKATTNDVGEAMDSVLLQVTRALVHKRNPPATFLDIGLVPNCETNG